MGSKVTFVCGGKLVPASRYRVHPVAKRLESRGFDTTIIHGYGRLDQKIPFKIARRFYRLICRVVRAIRMWSLKPNGPVIIQRLALPWWSAPERKISQKGGLILFDFDDAVFLNHSGEVCKYRMKAFQDICSSSAHVIAGNSWLADQVDSAKSISVFPTCIDTSRYAPRAEQKARSCLRIGWIGTSGNFPYLEQLIDPLEKLRAEGFDFEFLICSDERERFLIDSLNASFIRWAEEVELEVLQSFDIGVMPLEDNDWCRGKCSFKLIQYMAVGCVPVASRVGMNIDVIEHEIDGLLVEQDEWYRNLKRLLQDDGLRSRIGLNARSTAVAKYDISRAADDYLKLILELE